MCQEYTNEETVVPAPQNGLMKWEDEESKWGKSPERNLCQRHYILEWLGHQYPGQQLKVGINFPTSSLTERRCWDGVYTLLDSEKKGQEIMSAEFLLYQRFYVIPIERM